MNFEAFIGDITSNSWNVFGAEVYSGGRLIHAWGDTRENRHPIYSATKTITSIAAGMAIDDGKLDIRSPLIRYLPGDIVRDMPPAQREAYSFIPIERLLTMSVSGYPFRPSGESWLKSSLEIPIADIKRKEFDYSNISAYLVGVAAANALGEDLYAYLTRRLFGPLEIPAPPFARCPDEYFYGASSMELTVNELSRIGLMLANGGVFNGKRIVSEKYVNEATSAKQPNREGGYGYFIWKYKDGFSINGKWQQKCYVLPGKDMMVTFLSNIQEKYSPLAASMEKNIFDT